MSSINSNITDMCSSGRAANLDMGSNNASRPAARSNRTGGGRGSSANDRVGRARGAARGGARGRGAAENPLDLLPDRCDPGQDCDPQQDKAPAEISVLVPPDKDSRLHTNTEQCRTSFRSWNRGKSTQEPRADLTQHLSGISRWAKERCQIYRTEVSIDGPEFEQHVEFPRWEDVDEFADTATFLKKGSYKITSSEGEPFAYVLDDVLSLEGLDSVPQSIKDDLVKMMPDALEALLAKDTFCAKKKGGPADWCVRMPPSDKNKRVRHTENEALPKDARVGTWHLGLRCDKYGKSFGPSADTKQTSSRTQNHVGCFYGSIAPFFCIVGSLFSMLQPVWANFYETIYLLAANPVTRPNARLIAVDDRQLWLQMALICNEQSAPHNDHQDIKYGWVAMFCHGNFTGGNLVLPQLGLAVEYRPGTLIYLRSNWLQHYISKFQGERMGMVNFTHLQDITTLKNELVRGSSEVKLEALVKLDEVFGVTAKEHLWQPESKVKVEQAQQNVEAPSLPGSRSSKPNPKARVRAKAANIAKKNNARSARRAAMDSTGGASFS